MTLFRISHIILLLGILLLLDFLKPIYAADAEATVHVENETFRVTGWSWSIENPVAVIGSGGAAGKAIFGSLLIETPSNNFSTRLLDLIASGQIIPEITLIDGNLSIVAEAVSIVGLTLIKPGRHTAEFVFRNYQYTTGGSATCFDIYNNAGC